MPPQCPPVVHAEVIDQARIVLTTETIAQRRQASWPGSAADRDRLPVRRLSLCSLWCQPTAASSVIAVAGCGSSVCAPVLTNSGTITLGRRARRGARGAGSGESIDVCEMSQGRQSLQLCIAAPLHTTLPCKLLKASVLWVSCAPFQQFVRRLFRPDWTLRKSREHMSPMAAQHRLAENVVHLSEDDFIV